MSPVALILLFSDIIPLMVAATANRQTSLFHATIWALAAWVSWLSAFVTASTDWAYFALSLTGCAGVAVLGARRPGAAAWNFVVVGLLVVLTLPLAEAVALDTTVRPGTLRTIFLASLLGVAIMNYLPTRLGGAAALVGIGAGVALSALDASRPVSEASPWCVGLAPWVGWAGVRLGSSSHANRLWPSLRDRYGLVWGLRLRDQFNRAAANAGLKCVLAWSGIKPADEQGREILAALVQRFL